VRPAITVPALLSSALCVLTSLGISQTRTPPATVITGTLLGADGAPMKLAHVQIWKGTRSTGATRSLVGADGRYAIATQYAGTLKVQFTGVDHYSATVPLLVARPATIVMDVRLKRYEFTDSLGRIKAIGDWNHFKSSTGRALVRQPDGRYTLDVAMDADTLAYQLVGLEKSGAGSINGPQTGRYAYDNGGGYHSVIPVKDGHATIVLDPSALVRVPGRLRVVFGDGSPFWARAYGLIHTCDIEQGAYDDSSSAAKERKDSVHFDWKPALHRRTVALARERNPLLRQLLLLQLWDATTAAATHDTGVARRVIAEIPPSSPWLSLLPNAVGSVDDALQLVYSRAKDPGEPSDTMYNRKVVDWYERIASANPDSGVKVQALDIAIWFARTLRDDARMNADYSRLLTDFPDDETTAWWKSQLAPDRVLRPGIPMPDFHFTALDDTTVTYNPASLAGKMYVLDFWASWCGPCRGEMKWLHAAHDSLASQGLEILSVSLDENADSARTFRRGEWKMPWLHAWAGGFDNPQVKKLEILAIPRAILIGSDGHILAADADLRGENLMPTLRRALQSAGRP